MIKRFLLLPILLLAGCNKPPIIENNIPNYVGKYTDCQVIEGIITKQTGEYIYIEGIYNDMYDTYSTGLYSGWTYLPECYIKPETDQEKIYELKVLYEGILNDDYWLACRHVDTQPIKMIMKKQCQYFKESELKGYRYECDMKLDEYSSKPYFCI